MSKDIALMNAALHAETNPESATLSLVELGFTSRQARRLLFVRWLVRTGRLSEGHNQRRELDKVRLISDRPQAPAEPQASLPEAA